VFLKASIKHFLSKERPKDRSWKRGGRNSDGRLPWIRQLDVRLSTSIVGRPAGA
jgi:hypothetical protein